MASRGTRPRARSSRNGGRHHLGTAGEIISESVGGIIPERRAPSPGIGRERKRNFVGQHFWARGYFVSTVGRDEAVIREYIKKQEQEDMRLDQLNLWR